MPSTERGYGERPATDSPDQDIATFEDGVHFGEHTSAAALGINIDGVKHPLAIKEAQRRTPPWSPA
jgi:hypothetical protein